MEDSDVRSLRARLREMRREQEEHEEQMRREQEEHEEQMRREREEHKERERVLRDILREAGISEFEWHTCM